MPQTFQGRTEDVEAPFLGADFWKKGEAVSGVVVRQFDTLAGRAYVLALDNAVDLGGELEEQVSIGAMKGFLMALQAAKVDHLVNGDVIRLECTGVNPPTKEGYSPRVNFVITVIRK